MSVKDDLIIMNLRAEHGAARLNAITRAEWEQIVADFPPAVRGRAANLAAHNYDVALVNDRLMIATPHGGAWFSKAGEQTNFSKEEWDALYPIVPKPTEPASAANNYNRHYDNATAVYAEGGGTVKRENDLQQDALRSLAARVASLTTSDPS